MLSLSHDNSKTPQPLLFHKQIRIASFFLLPLLLPLFISPCHACPHLALTETWDPVFEQWLSLLQPITSPTPNSQ